jgi:hypothetical protein
MSRSHEQQGPQPTRRDFARSLAGLAAVPLAAAASPVLAQSDKPKPADALTDAAQALGELARVRFGKFLGEDQLKAVRRQILRGVFTSRRLQQVKLQNGQEPAFVFRADLP